MLRPMGSTYFRRGFGLKGTIQGQLTADYHSAVIDALRANEYTLTVDHLTFHLAREFGFCYGVDRAVDYAYETRTKFPDRRLFLVGEIIHNPHVNRRLAAMGIHFLHRPESGEFNFDPVTVDDVVILPAFGVTMRDFQRLRSIGCILVDTTCGSVLNVWKRVDAYARDGFTSVIHGKHWHEETKATASQVEKYPHGRYLVVLDMAEARRVMDFMESGGDPAPLHEYFAPATSAEFDFAHDLQHIGLANQTTMLSGESLAIADAFRETMRRIHGPEDLDARVRTFDTICSATQERQDAMEALLEEPLDLMIVVGGYNSSNTSHLAELAESRGVRTYHIDDAECVDLDTGCIQYQPVGDSVTRDASGWLEGVHRIGVTAGASTPNNKIGETIARICALAGVDLDTALG